MRTDLVLSFSRSLILTVILASLSQTALARPPMTVATFLATHDRLSHSKDELNVSGADFYASALLRSIYDGGAKALVANQAATKAGHPLFCLPAGQQQFELHIEELHMFFDTIPQEQRGMSMDDAMLRFAEHKFPCVTKP